MDAKSVMSETDQKMKKTLEVVNNNLQQLRSGRANPAMLDNLKADYYGTPTPVKQLANIAVPEPKSLVISPWDANALKPIEKAILESDLGITPIVDGKNIRLNVPTLTRERRDELARISNKVCEEGRVALRSLRREANEKIKQIEKDKKITEDDSFKHQTEVQKLTDKYIQIIDQAQAQKEKELSQV